MSKSYTIHAPNESGGSVAVTIDVTGPAAAVVTIRTYKLPAPHNGTVPTHSEAHGLCNLKLTPAKSGLVGQLSSLFGPVGHVDCQLLAGAGPGDRSVTIVVTGTVLLNRALALKLTDDDYDGLLAFISSAGFA